MIDNGSTIAALATAPLPAGLAVIRISGPQAGAALAAVFRSTQSPLESPRRMILGNIISCKSGQVLDRGFAVFMAAPQTYTGEDLVELQLHGSPLLAQKVLRSLYQFGVQPAEAGEFTKRAFLNGKIDLIQAEAVSDLIAAASDQALQLANEHLAGRFSSAIENLGEPLRDTLAEIEAQLDFSEEELPSINIGAIEGTLKSVVSQLQSLIESYSSGRILKEGFRVLLTGAPNVGKSTLLNALLGCERAIVTEHSGTTRDLIEEAALIDNVQFIFCDSAGITAQPENEVEQIGIARARQRIKWADLVLWLVDASSNQSLESQSLEYQHAKQLWLLYNKTDLVSPFQPATAGRPASVSKVLSLSVKTGCGLTELKAELVREVQSCLPEAASGSNIVTTERQLLALSRAKGNLLAALDLLGQQAQLELVSLELRSALTSLEELVGKTYSDDILGRVFSRFCIGK